MASIPQARLVKHGAESFAPPPLPPPPPGAFAVQAREALAMAIGLWPLTAVVLLAFALLFFAGHWSAP